MYLIDVEQWSYSVPSSSVEQIYAPYFCANSVKGLILSLSKNAQMEICENCDNANTNLEMIDIWI